MKKLIFIILILLFLLIIFIGIFYLLIILIIILFINNLINNLFDNYKSYFISHQNDSLQILKKDAINSFKTKNNMSEIIGLVFYGRRNSVKILLRYLDINLRKNGGILDKVIFAIHTNVKEDLDYIETFVGKNNQYYKMNN